jgi:hypothetical protein
MRRWIGLGSFAVLSLVGCGDDSSCPTCPQETFAFRIAVRDAAGDPVPGLQVSLLYPPLSPRQGSESPRVQALHATTVRFTAPDSAIVTLDVVDLAHQLVGQPLSSYPVMAGLYSVAVAPNAPYGVYWIRLVARHGESVVFRDSIRAAWWPLDPTTNVLGPTDADGVLQTKDALRFPNVLDLPPLVRTNETGDSLGTFSYPDTVALVLAGPPGGPFEMLSVYRLVVRPGVNDFQLSWPNAAQETGWMETPVQPPHPAGDVRERRLGAGQERGFTPQRERHEPRTDIVADEPPVVFPPSEWRLYQNTPNPMD